MTPQTFQADVLAWLGAFVAAAVAAFAAYKTLKKEAQDAGVLADLKATLGYVKERQDRHGAVITALLDQKVPSGAAQVNINQPQETPALPPAASPDAISPPAATADTSTPAEGVEGD